MWIPPQAQPAIFQGFPSPLSRPSILMSLWKFVLMVEFLMRPGALTGGLGAGVASHCPEGVPRRGALPALLDRGPLFTRPQPAPSTPQGEETGRGSPSVSRSESESTSEPFSASGTPAKRPAAAAASFSRPSFSPDFSQGPLLVMPILQLPALRSGLLATAPRTRRGMWVDPPAAPTNRMWRVANRRPLQPIDKRSPGQSPRQPGVVGCCRNRRGLF